MTRNYKPRNITALLLSVSWLLISIFLYQQGTYQLFWAIFALIAGLLAAAALWVLLTDRPEGP
ncbi:MAG: hypothetical protein SOR40_07140 [Rothia sp. (in: high G+C Gram-positive bacteria)]|nr:hypothetical protein [Rothia sp. (in: high G+C Gram-positive bacteria)]